MSVSFGPERSYYGCLETLLFYGGGALAHPPGVCEGRYGKLTVVESPDAEIVKVPDAVEL
jgi:hypothetical protein